MRSKKSFGFLEFTFEGDWDIEKQGTLSPCSNTVKNVLDFKNLLLRCVIEDRENY